MIPPIALDSSVEFRQTESLLVLSDVHLGSDLNDHPQPAGFGKRSRRVDRDLVGMIDHYRRTPPPSGARWRIVFAGDFVDFIGIAILPTTETLSTEPSLEEREHGLGNAADHALAKIRRVAERHADVFAALAAFLADGHAMTIVHGNHDVEFHWETVQNEMRALVVAHAASPEIAAAITERIEFAPLFFWAEGVAYIEHGHQYDAMCANEHPLMPLSPLDPRRIARGFCDVLLRFVVRPTRGLREHGHENMGIFAYLAFGAGLGVRGLIGLGVSFARAIIEMFRLRSEWIGKAAVARAKAIREEHERRLAQFAIARRMDLSRITALLALHERPIIRTIHGILGSLLIDRLALAITSIVLLAIVGAFATHHMSPFSVAFVVAALVAGWITTHRYLARQRKIDPDDALRERAGRLATLFPAAFVVMGHTHIPAKIPLAEGQSTYINVGSWAEEEDQADVSGGYKAARTHLVIHTAESGPVAEFLTWESEIGPKRFGG